MVQQRISIEGFRKRLGSTGSVIILMKFFSMFFSCNQTIQLNPKLSEAWDNKGFILNKLGKY